MRTIWGKDSNSNKIIDNGFIAGNRGLEAVYVHGFKESTGQLQ